VKGCRHHRSKPSLPGRSGVAPAGRRTHRCRHSYLWVAPRVWGLRRTDRRLGSYRGRPRRRTIKAWNVCGEMGSRQVPRALRRRRQALQETVGRQDMMGFLSERRAPGDGAAGTAVRFSQGGWGGGGGGGGGGGPVGGRPKGKHTRCPDRSASGDGQGGINGGGESLSRACPAGGQTVAACPAGTNQGSKTHGATLHRLRLGGAMMGPRNCDSPVRWPDGLLGPTPSFSEARPEVVFLGSFCAG